MMRRTSLGVLKLVAAAAVAACGGSSGPDVQNTVAEDQRVTLWDSAPVDYGAGPGVAVDDDVDGRETALGQRTAMSIAVPADTARTRPGESVTTPSGSLRTSAVAVTSDAVPSA